MIFPKLNENFIKLSYVIQDIVFISFNSIYPEDVTKELEKLKKQKFIKRYEYSIVPFKEVYIWDLVLETKENKYNFIIDLSKDLNNCLTLKRNEDVFYLDPFNISYSDIY